MDTNLIRRKTIHSISVILAKHIVGEANKNTPYPYIQKLIPKPHTRKGITKNKAQQLHFHMWGTERVEEKDFKTVVKSPGKW